MVNNLNNEIFVFYLADCNCAEIVQRTHTTHAICKIHIILYVAMNGVYNPISVPSILIMSSPLGERLLFVLEFLNETAVCLSLLAYAFYMSHAALFY